MLIKDAMSKPPMTVRPDQSAYDAYELMLKKKIRRLPVMKGERLVGIVTDRNIRDAKPSSLADLPKEAAREILRTTQIKDIMTEKIITVISDDPLEQAALLMNEHKIGGLPVMEKDKVVGVITESDIFKLFCTFFGAAEGYFQVVLLDTPETRAAVLEAMKRFTGRVRSILFSPKFPEIVMVFKMTAGKNDTQDILGELRKCSFQILDWHLFESKAKAVSV